MRQAVCDGFLQKKRVSILAGSLLKAYGWGPLGVIDLAEMVRGFGFGLLRLDALV